MDDAAAGPCGAHLGGMAAPTLSSLRRAVSWHRRPLAAVCAALAVLATLAATRPEPPPTTTVATASRSLPGGARLGAAEVELRDVPVSLVPEGAVTEPAALEGRTLAAPASAGSILTEVDVVAPRRAGGHGARPGAAGRRRGRVAAAVRRRGRRGRHRPRQRRGGGGRLRRPGGLAARRRRPGRGPARGHAVLRRCAGGAGGATGGRAGAGGGRGRRGSGGGARLRAGPPRVPVRRGRCAASFGSERCDHPRAAPGRRGVSVKGFRDFLLRGNLIELAVAFIMASAFTAVVTAFTSIITDLIGLLFDVPDFSTTSVGGVSVGGFINAVIAFVVIAAVLYWGLVKPYQKFQQRQKSRQPGDVEETPYSTTESLLVEIRDLLRGR
ncbi:hypothetical protein DT076_05390 [Desertihabitans brevis]|uniref:SAF domain-containing protein n=1 Tax=Desertihabitans brevis TaxID=2268447 RepID=A0A367Z0U4_9ACTN|nr:hypothetical protein DT076_05390 [Desertihabitans brevis]